MLSKIVAIFLIGMVVLALVGRLRLPGGRSLSVARKCPGCGRYRIGRGACPCGAPPPAPRA